MAEQFPEEGGKIPRQGLEDSKQTWAPGPLPGSLRRDAKEPAPPPPSPDRTGVSLGIFAFPLPKPRSTSPGTPILTNLCSLSLQVLLSPPPPDNTPAVPHPPSPKAPSPAAAPDSHLPLGTLSIHSWHRRCHCSPVPTTLAQSCLGSLPWGPPALAPVGTGAGDPGVPLRALPGSRGDSGSSLRHTRCPWAAGGAGGGRSLWGHCEAGAGHQAWQRPDCGGRGPSR